MKTLILYATKHGAAGEIARRIAQRMDGATVCDLKQGDIPSLAQYDCVILGSSLYVGAIRKEAKAYLSQNIEGLRGKKIGLFLSGMDATQGKACFEANFAPELLQAARAKRFLGGIFDPKKAGALERFVMKIAAKQSGYTNSIDDGAIKQFVEDLYGQRNV